MEFTAKTIEEAKELALKELGLSEDQVDIEIIEQPTKGLFGKLKGKAVISVTKKPTGNENARAFVENLLKILDINAKAVLDEENEKAEINLIAEKSSEVIGYRGEILDAIQTLASAVANIGKEEYKKVVVNCEGYREIREETLISLAHKLEEKATEMRREVILEAMNPFERKIIHSALAESKTVTTKSEGKEPERYVVIVPFDKDENSTPYNAARSNGNGFKGKKGNKKGFNKRDNRARKNGSNAPKKSGFIGEKKKSSGFTFGTYLGNSNKQN